MERRIIERFFSYLTCEQLLKHLTKRQHYRYEGFTLRQLSDILFTIRTLRYIRKSTTNRTHVEELLGNTTANMAQRNLMVIKNGVYRVRRDGASFITLAALDEAQVLSFVIKRQVHPCLLDIENYFDDICVSPSRGELRARLHTLLLRLIHQGDLEVATINGVRWYKEPNLNANNNSGGYFDTECELGLMADPANYPFDCEVCAETQVMTNVVPIVPGFSCGPWFDLQCYIREKLVRENKSVYVCSGPLFMPGENDGKTQMRFDVLGEGEVSVPTHFFKVIIIETHDGNLELESYMMPNTKPEEGEEVKLDDFLTPLCQIEHASGLIFFPEKKVCFTSNNKRRGARLHAL